VIVAGVLDVFISLGEVLAEGLIGVDNSQLGSVPAQLASAHMEVPDSLRNKEVVVLDLAVEVVRRNVEESLTAVEVKVDAVALGDGGLPGRMILVGVERVDCITPGILKSLNLSEILFLAQGDDQVVILDHTAVSQHNLITLRVELLNSDVV
jgi:hypothetical protein